MLQTGCPHKLSIIGVIKCRSSGHALDIERQAHDFFKKYRIRGEWFKCADYVITKIYDFVATQTEIENHKQT